MKLFFALAILGWNTDDALAFTQTRSRCNLDRHSGSTLFAQGFGATAVKERTTKKSAAAPKPTPIETLSVADAKKQLIDLIPRMTGNEEEYRAVEAYVNLLEDKYSPVQTIDFLNLAMDGDWQLVSRDF